MDSLRSQSTFSDKLNILRKYLAMRGEADPLLGQRYVSEGSIIDRLEILAQKGMLDRRILSIGDDDLTGLSCAIFGNPVESLIVDIDKRLSEILFDANLEHDLPVRFLYHDMRIKLIEVLRSQYSLILIEPPWTKAGIDVFVSRSIQCLSPDHRDGIFVSIPSGKMRGYLDDFIERHGLSIIDEINGLTVYDNSDEIADFIQLNVPVDTKVSVSGHWLDAFYEHEVEDDHKPYRCSCDNIIDTGPNHSIKSLDDLLNNGCPNCGQNKIFVYSSQVKIE